MFITCDKKINIVDIFICTITVALYYINLYSPFNMVETTTKRSKQKTFI